MAESGKKGGLAIVAKPPALPKAPPPLPLAAAELTGVQKSLPEAPHATSEVPAAIEDGDSEQTVAVAKVTANTDILSAQVVRKPEAAAPPIIPSRPPDAPAPPPSIEKTRVAVLGGSSLPGVGDRIGQYIVDRVIGSGGMGLVVAARHEALNELVAIKLLRPKAAGDEVHAERFSREARAIIKIKSEHVVRVLDAGTLESGSPYIVMEYLVGRDLAQLLRAEIRMPYPRAADLMLQVCEAVASAHAVGVVHRDLKPSNFFVTNHNDGSTVVKVLDFGIAKAIGQEGMGVDPNLTETQAVFGSPTYMSPEQIRSAKHVDHRSDVWSLGICLYELMTGKLPFAADNVAGLLASIVADPPFFPRGFVPDLPEALEELLLHCLTKDVRQRVQSVAELAFRLAPFSSNTTETHLLIERIDRLARASGQATTTGPRLPLPPPGPSSSSNPIAIMPAPAPSTPPLPGESRNSGVAFGSTGTDLAADAAKGRQSTLAAIAIGLSLAVLILGGFGVYHFERNYGHGAAAPTASPASPSTDPPRPSATAAAPVASASSAAVVPAADPTASGTSQDSQEPSAKPAAIKKITPPPKAHPVVRPPPPPAAPATTKAVDPTHDRF